MSEGKRVVRQYPMEFKVDAVKLLEEKGYTVSEADIDPIKRRRS